MVWPRTSAIPLESQTLRWKSGDWSIPASAELPSLQASAGQSSSSSGPCCDPIRTGLRGQVRPRFGAGGRASADARDLAWHCENKQARPYGVPQVWPSRPGHCIGSDVFDAVHGAPTAASALRRDSYPGRPRHRNHQQRPAGRPTLRSGGVADSIQPLMLTQAVRYSIGLP